MGHENRSDTDRVPAKNACSLVQDGRRKKAAKGMQSSCSSMPLPPPPPPPYYYYDYDYYCTAATTTIRELRQEEHEAGQRQP